MLEKKREKFKKIELRTGKIFSRLGLTPNQYTLISLFSVFFAFYFLINLDLLLALVFFFAAGLLDFVDGAVARTNGISTKKGAYLDTISDRYVEGIILFGFLFLPLQPFILPASFWIFLALFGSLITTYSKSAAKEKELIKNEPIWGLMGRPERLVLIFLAIIIGIFNFSWTICPIIILAVFSNISALWRIYSALKLKES